MCKARQRDKCSKCRCLFGVCVFVYNGDFISDNTLINNYNVIHTTMLYCAQNR